MPHSRPARSEDLRLAGDDELEQLLRDAERIVDGLEGVQQLAIALTTRETRSHDER